MPHESVVIVCPRKRRKLNILGYIDDNEPYIKLSNEIKEDYDKMIAIVREHIAQLTSKGVTGPAIPSLPSSPPSPPQVMGIGMTLGSGKNGRTL